MTDAHLLQKYVIITLIICVSVPGIVGSHLLLERLKQHFPAVWDELGQPRLFRRAQGTARKSFTLFLLLRRYPDLKDAGVTRYGDIVWVCSAVNSCLAVYWILVLGGTKATL